MAPTGKGSNTHWVGFVCIYTRSTNQMGKGRWDRRGWGNTRKPHGLTFSFSFFSSLASAIFSIVCVSPPLFFTTSRESEKKEKDCPAKRGERAGQRGWECCTTITTTRRRIHLIRFCSDGGRLSLTVELDQIGSGGSFQCVRMQIPLNIERLVSLFVRMGERWNELEIITVR